MTTDETARDTMSTITTSDDLDVLDGGAGRTRTGLGGKLSTLSGKVDLPARVRRTASTVRTKASAGGSHARTVVPRQARRAGQTAKSNPVPVAASVLALVGATVAVAVRRRRQAQARAASTRWTSFIRR